ncbi:ribonuclease HII [Achromobacter sp. F4_2707]|uniref:ribonuclease HII n=1 Tax=Achromobacter sp. F4_2707 TaxID=3114286 RepID=UPI0039C6938B
MQNSLFEGVDLPTGLCAGVDEAGRGPLAGPVFAAAVILNDDLPIAGLNDSKKLSAARREALALLIQKHALAWHIASASVAEIDELNILGATMLAMRRACEGLLPAPQNVLVDGNRVPQGLACAAQSIVGGDARVPAIAAASILAKTARDAYCLEMHMRFPEYGFNQHKGYGTAVHLQRLAELGPCDEHRRSFAPVRRHFETESSS